MVTGKTGWLDEVGGSYGSWAGDREDTMARQGHWDVGRGDSVRAGIWSGLLFWGSRKPNLGVLGGPGAKTGVRRGFGGLIPSPGRLDLQMGAKRAKNPGFGQDTGFCGPC